MEKLKRYLICHDEDVEKLEAEVERLTALLGKSIVSGAIDITGHNVVEENERLTAELAQVKADMRTVRERIKGLESIQIHGGTEGWRMCDYDYQAMSNTLAEIRRILNEKESSREKQ